MKIFIFFSFLLFFNNTYGKSNDSPDLNYKNENLISWNQWKENLKKEFSSDDLKISTLNNLDTLKFNKRVIELDRKQPEFKLGFNQYLKRYLNNKNKKKLLKKYNENKVLLDNLEKKFGVDSRILVSLWFVETSFGEYLGRFDVLNSLASLAYDGGEKNFF